MIPALVLTAGLATRLRPLSFVRAKAALPVAGEPLIHRILRFLGSSGVRNVVLNLHHLPHTITSLIGDGADMGLRVRYSWEVPVLGSAGGPRRALPLLRDESASGSFLIVNGDTLTDVEVPQLLEHHRRSGALVTLAVVANTSPNKYGGLLVDEGTAMIGTVKRGAAEPSYHFIGVQIAEPEAFASVPADVPWESVATLYPALIASRPGSVRVFHSSADFLDIGTPSDYLESSLLLARREGRGLIHGARTRVDGSARVIDSILWDDVVVEAGAMLRECVVADGARVPADTSWRGVTLRVASGELAPGERRVEELAVASL